MHRKSDALDKFIELNVESENQLGKHIKAFQIDQDEKYMSSLIDSFLKEYVECTWNSTPKWSSGKKKNQALMDMVRSMMSFSSLLVCF